nr:MltA domain-containing protein [uncultured Desulfuromonas sp.]
MIRAIKKRHVLRLVELFLVSLLFFPTGCAVTPGKAPSRPVTKSERGDAVRPVNWSALPGWQDDDPLALLQTFVAGCQSLKYRSGWKEVCSKAVEIHTPAAARSFFEHDFQPWALLNDDGSEDGLITGYYVPDLDGSRQSSSQYPYPVYARPDDLLVIDLSSVYPELGDYRLRGRIEGQRVVPYWNRAEIDGFNQPLHGHELCWVGDPVELFFLQIQGSGRINLDDGTQIMVNYADQNGHPYQSIGALLLERGEMTRDQMSMQNIAAWGRQHPSLVQDMLNENSSYVFFRELDEGVTSPPGALGIPLTGQRSLAVDPRYIPLGAPVYVATRWPDRDEPLQRAMVAQDTGGAIKGRVRADFFWGVGDDAGEMAGRMKYPGRLWLLLPLGIEPPGR